MEQAIDDAEQEFVRLLLRRSGHVMPARIEAISRSMKAVQERADRMSVKLARAWRAKKREKLWKEIALLQQELAHLRSSERRELWRYEEFVTNGESPFRNMFRRIREISRVKYVSFTETTLIVETDVLYGKDDSGTWHRVGRFLIQLNMDPQNTARTWNSSLYVALDKIPVLAKRQKIIAPPNVADTGKIPCFGDAAVPISNAWRNGDIASLVAILVRYPECAGRGNNISLWPEVSASEVPQWYLDTFPSAQ